MRAVTELILWGLLVVGIVVVAFAAVIEGFCLVFAVFQSGAWCAKRIRETAPRYIPARLSGLIAENLLRAADSPDSRRRAASSAPSKRLLKPAGESGLVNETLLRALETENPWEEKYERNP